MKKLIILLLLLTAFCSAKMKYANANSADTIFSKLHLVSDGLGTLDTIGDTLVDFYSKTLKLDSASTAVEWAEGQIWYDSAGSVHVFDTGINGVRIQAGEEIFYPVFNNSGAQIDDGFLVYASGRDTARRALEIDKADNRSFQTSAQVLGWTTHDCPDQSFCKVTNFGKVNNINTSGVSEVGILYLDTGGLATNAVPIYPAERIFVGTVLKSHATLGAVQVSINRLERTESSRTEPFSTEGLAASTYYIGGFYSGAATDYDFNTCSASQTIGASGNASHAHMYIVASGPASITGGVVGLRVSGSTYDEITRVVNNSDFDTLTMDVTTLTTNQYIETPKKFNGVSTIEYFTVSGTPTACTGAWNAGESKYEDFSNQNFTLTNIDCSGLGGSNDATFNIQVYHHKTTGWTYSATSFVPGDGIIAQFTEMAPNDNIVTGEYFAWEAAELNVYVQGGGSEGLVTLITTGQPNTAKYSRCHYAAKIEEL